MKNSVMIVMMQLYPVNSDEFQREFLISAKQTFAHVVVTKRFPKDISHHIYLITHLGHCCHAPIKQPGAKNADNKIRNQNTK
jgi:hypothetical protein